ncbi:alanine racemase [Acanthopleuribacter pedis]|uniref:Alanine racemase n=1 Tax=Acanthopleuribacter pedis TaxID=442870 RepID=A0A8J7QFZ0_9BACT|nr:alanine racemase [Acanthopleuribacter pedis]MBO1317858.1 alanine racemase [Acanthopleuribacter pedis]
MIRQVTPTANRQALEAPSAAAAGRTNAVPHRDYAFYREVIRNHALPLAYLDLDLLDANIAAFHRRADGKNIRIASKSLRAKAVLRYLLESRRTIQGIMCFSGREALYLADQGFDDLLIAYPLVNADLIRALAEQVKQGTTLYLMVDSAAHIDVIDHALQGIEARLPLCLDLDMSTPLPGLHFGVLRSPLQQIDQALALHNRIQRSDKTVLAGVMGYEAQIAGVQDQIPGRFMQNQVVRLLKKWAAPKVAARREAVVRALKDAGAQLRFVNGGGTGSVEQTIREAWVSEVTVGSGFYGSHLFDYYHHFDLLPAAGFALEVVRIPKAGIVTCAGGGYIASGGPGQEKLPLPYLPAGARLTPLEAAGEVQTPIQGAGDLKLGDPIFFRHSKAGELCERFTHLHWIREGRITEKVTTYRGDQQCYF